MNTRYFKQSGSWCAETTFEHEGTAIVLSTYPMGGSPKTSYHEKKDGKLNWDNSPCTFGYMVGFEVKANRNTVEEAHERGLDRLRLFRPGLFLSLSPVV